jgi:molybdopterin/thiamine biosynthesis adenylyltransferase/nitroreductase
VTVGATAPQGAACDDGVWSPLILDPAAPGCDVRLHELVAEGRVWHVHDTLELQLRDLVRARGCGGRLSEADVDERVESVVDGVGLEAYGSWIHYPWSGRLVRVLPELEFRELRLDRNRDKITASEQRRLREATVAIVGLSVGNAAAITLTMEGAYGHLKLADFDRLELSNMNRLRAGIHDLGVPKAVLAARQIVELDPYASLTLFTDGATPENVDSLLTDEPRVDVVVDECDAIAMKFLLRERARALRIPVVMETSDRGLIDIERFDLDHERPIFHGRCGATSASEVAGLERAEQLALVLAIVDAEAISARAAASLLEIETTLSTWPQLASEVTLGGATITTAVRRLALGESLRSGRSYVDLEHVLAQGCDPVRLETAPRSTPTSGTPAGRNRVRPRAPATSRDAIGFVVEHAVLAPSGGNSQPWTFRDEDAGLAVHVDLSRSSLLDTSRHASQLAVGAAIENASVAASYLGLRVELEPFPDPRDPSLAALLRLESKGRREPASLLPAVRGRVTNRCLGTPMAPDASECALLAAAADVHGGRLQLLTDRRALEDVAELIGEGDRIRFLCPPLHAEAIDELRWSEQDARETGDGIDVATLELGTAGRSALRLLARADTAAALRAAGGGKGLLEIARRAIDGAGAVGLLRAADSNPASWLRAGRALERVWLVATELGLAFQPMTALLYMLELLDRPRATVFASAERDELRALGTRLDRLFEADADRPPALLFRLAKGAPAPSRRTFRRPLADVLEKPGPAAASLHR